MTSQPGLETIAIHILTNILKTKGNQIIKFGRLIEHNMRNVFLGKLCTKCGEDTILRPFSQKSTLSISLDQKLYTVRFYFMPSLRLSKYIEVKLQATCFYFIKSFLREQKEVWN